MNKVMSIDSISNIFKGNASASAFGWEFQANAAIYLAFDKIKDFEEIKVEGLVDDIEIYFKNSDPIFIQVKSQENPESTSNTLKHFRNGLETLMRASAHSKCSTLIYLSNINNPLSNKSVNYYFNSLTTYNYSNLPEVVQNLINKQIDQVLKDPNNKMDDSFKEKFMIVTIPYFGEYLETRYRYIKEKINLFLSRAELNEVISDDLLEYFQNQFFKNATSKRVKLKKEDIIWPIIVLSTLKISEYTLDDYDEGYAIEIRKKYQQFINKQSHKFCLITKVMREFESYKRQQYEFKKSTKMLIEEFLKDSWRVFKGEIVCENEELQEYLIKIILESILRDRMKIEKIKKEANL